MKVYSVIVCYNPDVNSLKSICYVLKSNKCSVILVENTESSSLLRNLDFSDYTIIHMGENAGVAHAQNVGIKCAIEKSADTIVFFDQDSIIENDFLPCLLAPLNTGEPRVVAPVFFDNAKGFEFPSMRLNKYGFLTKICRGNKQVPYDVDVIISSGTAATIETFDIAGLMDEDFFIDFVDTEWCLRCRTKNIPIQVVPTAIMKHSIGETSINFGIMRGFVHSPERCYYKIRNCFLLFRKEDIPFLLASKEILSALIHHTILFIFVKNRASYAKNYILAFYHGIKGIAGKKPV
jgi:rhamnosyltransferase